MGVQAVLKPTCLLEHLFKRSLVGRIFPDSPEYTQKLKHLLKQPRAVYAGFDATGSSLHIGNLATIMNLLHFHRYGHKVICVIGDATARIGDPSGHTEDRKEVATESIMRNAASIEETLRRVFSNFNQYFNDDTSKSEHKSPIIVRNSSWYKDKDVVEFVGDIFRQVRVPGLLKRKAIADRMACDSAGLNMSEFCYQIFQAYDWVTLRRLYDCRVQIGGSDQEGNINTGHDLIKKCFATVPHDSFGILGNLITNEKGTKLGKSSVQSNHIWLRPEMTSPYNLYQFFRRTPDKDVEKFLKIYSFYDDKTIESFIYKHLKKPEDVWYCQKKLAEHVVQLVHGEEGLKSAKRITHAFFQRNPLDIANLRDDELNQLFDEDSIIRLIHKEGLRVSDLTRKAKCFRTELDAEYVISRGGLWLNDARVDSINALITEDLVIGNNITIMRVGKKNYFVFKWIN